MGTSITLHNAVIDYPSLFTAREYKGKWRFQGTMIVEKGSDNDTAIQAALAAIREGHPGKKLADLYLDGDKEFPGNPHYSGKMFLRAYKNQEMGPPAVLTAENKPMTALEASTIYKGAIVNAIIDAYVPKSPNDDKICWGLVGVQKALEEGTPITGEGDVDPESLFKPLDAGQNKPSFL